MFGIPREYVRKLKAEAATHYRRITRAAAQADLDRELAPTRNAAVPKGDQYITEERVAAILQAAEQEWLSCVTEPGRSGKPVNGAERIDQYIRGPVGLGWPRARVGKRAVPYPTDVDGVMAYTKDGDFSWCGAFAAECLGSAGLKKTLRYKYMPSCYRLIQGAPGGGRWITGSRRVPNEEVRPGDIVIVGYFEDKKKPWGSHITLCAGVNREKGYIETYEGNAGGESPKGGHHNGVVKQRRYFKTGRRKYGIMHVIRLLESDFQ